MMNKLYYKDPYTQSFSTKIISQKVDEVGNYYVTLEETAFYPTGGGQPHDTGTVNGINIVDVEEIEGEIRHYLEQPLPSEVELIHGEIDWERRFDHMQQHAGQHILSAAFEELFGYKTVSFHLGKETLTIDLDTEKLHEEASAKAEQLANQIILENRPIETKWVSENELSQYKLRKELSVKDNIRLVIIPDFDYNGCGGTHPSSTGQVAAIKILGWERQKKKVRVEFVCGKRVLTQLHQKHKVLAELTALLNAPEQDIPTAAQKLLENTRTLEKSVEVAKEALLQFEVQGLLSSATNQNNHKVIRKAFVNRPIQELQQLAKSLTSITEDAIVFLTVKNEDRLQFVCARGAQVSVNIKTIVGEILPLINGKGGGSEAFAQGGGDASITGEQLLEEMIAKI